MEAFSPGSGQGHEVYVAHDGRAAVDTAQMFHPQVVLLDIGLPKMDGYEVAKRLREWPEMRIELVYSWRKTTSGSTRDARRAGM